MSTIASKLIDPKQENAKGECIHKDALTEIRKRGGQWAVYQNHDLGNRNVGHLKCLRYGAGCTFEAPPAHYPDPSISQGTNYLLVGQLDLESGVIT